VHSIPNYENGPQRKCEPFALDPRENSPSLVRNALQKSANWGLFCAVGSIFCERRDWLAALPGPIELEDCLNGALGFRLRARFDPYRDGLVHRHPELFRNAEIVLPKTEQLLLHHAIGG
jgi:hypothetical protein